MLPRICSIYSSRSFTKYCYWGERDKKCAKWVKNLVLFKITQHIIYQPWGKFCHSLSPIKIKDKSFKEGSKGHQVRPPLRLPPKGLLNLVRHNMISKTPFSVSYLSGLKVNSIILLPTLVKFCIKEWSRRLLKWPALNNGSVFSDGKRWHVAPKPLSASLHVLLIYYLCLPPSILYLLLSS